MITKINENGTLEIKVETKEEREKLKIWYLDNLDNLLFKSENVDILIDFRYKR